MFLDDPFTEIDEASVCVQLIGFDDVFLCSIMILNSYHLVAIKSGRLWGS